MNYLSVESLSKSFGERSLFQNISFGLDRGDKIALVANNGTGKSTLLRILAGSDVSDSGHFSFRDGIRVAFLEQEPSLTSNLNDTIKDFVSEANIDILNLLNEYNNALLASESGMSEDLKRLENFTAKMDARSAWDYERRLIATLNRFGIADLDQKIETLSGGQRKRLALAVTLVDQPDFLILDEPTNHLDIEMVEWLESFLMQEHITLLMVTHDRYFLDRVCNNILEIERGVMYRHKGNYGYFLQKRAERKAVFEIEREKAVKLMKKELEWLRRQPKARTTKSKARIDAFDEIKAKANSGSKDPELKLDVKMSRIGGKILELKKIYKSYGDNQILKGFDYTFKKGDRIGIVGKNGCGKSTFLNIITGNEKADSGKLNVGETIVYGYYNQQGLKVSDDKRVIDVLKEIAEVIQLSDGSKLTASQFLLHFMFTPEMQYTQVAKLSGGERRRLHLLTVLIKNPNFLILDEPTNDLDLLTLQKLEEFLESYNGVLMVVSHDRYFLDNLCDHLFVFQGGGKIKDFWGPYSDYKAQLIQEQKSPTKESVETRSSSGSQKQKLSYKDKFELEQLDKELPALEKEKAEIEIQLQNSNLPYDELQKLTDRMTEILGELEVKEIRWLELDEKR